MKVAALASLLGLVATAQAQSVPQGSNGPCLDSLKAPGADKSFSSCFSYPARGSCSVPGYTVPLVGSSKGNDDEYDNLITYDCGPSQICCLTCHPTGGLCVNDAGCCTSGDVCDPTTKLCTTPPACTLGQLNDNCSTEAPCCPNLTCRGGKCKLGNTLDDPWVEGLKGQRFLFKPKSEEDAWYAAISDPTLQVNLKLHSYDGVTEVDPERDFYTGATIQTFDEDGFAVQSLQIEVRDDGDFKFSCKDLGDNAPEHCLGGGAIDVLVNSVRMLEPGYVETGPGASLSAANVPASCQAISETQLRHQPRLQDNRRHLLAVNFENLLVQRDLKNPAECDRWVTSAKRNFGSIYKAPGTKSTLEFATPRLTSVIDFDTHIPNDISVAPMTFRIGYFMHAFNPHPQGSEGFIAETQTVRFDKFGQPIMSGKVLKGDDNMYRVDGPFGRDFAAKHLPM